MLLLYERGDLTLYQEQFEKHLEGHFWPITSEPRYVRPEGVALLTQLTPEQLKWCIVESEVVLHVSLLLQPKHRVKD